jgi:TolB-like protein/tetratricopeptide (TPR) repeat protein
VALWFILRHPPGWNRVAVLCFDNLSRDTADQYLADGLTEEITARLGQISTLDVKSRTAVSRFCGKTNRDPAIVGAKLQVASMVSGSVRRDGRRLRVSVELARTRDGDRLWGSEFDRPDTNLLDIQQDIAAAVGNTIAGRLDAKTRSTLTTRATRDPVAYDLYLRGNWYLAQRTKRSVERAISEYQLATRHDPRFADALGRLAYGYALVVYYGWSYHDLSADSVLDLGFASADSALRVDSNAAEAWMARGRFLEVRNPYRYEGVLAAYERAATLDSRNAEVRNMIGTALRELGDDSGATRAFHQALDLDPDRATTLTLLGIQAGLNRRFAEALMWGDSALAVDSEFYDAWVSRGFNRVLMGDTVGARADALDAARLPSGSHFSDQILLVIVEARAGRMTDARRGLGQLRRGLDLRRPGPLPGSLLAWAAVAVGEQEQGLTLLERVQPRGASLWFWLQSPGFDSVRSNPRFRRIVEESQPL